VPKLVWRVELVAELEPGVATETEVAHIERGEEVGPADLGLRLEEAKRLTTALQAEIVTAHQEHPAEVPQREPVAQPPQHHERDDVGRVLRPVQQAGAALVGLLAALPAAEPAVALGGAVRPLRDGGRSAAHAPHTLAPAPGA
jgi:hypothetical protein